MLGQLCLVQGEQDLEWIWAPGPGSPGTLTWASHITKSGKAVSTAKLAVQEVVVRNSTAEAVRRVGPGFPHFLAERSQASNSMSLSLSSLFCELDAIAPCHWASWVTSQGCLEGSAK